jgi:proteasome lid subunit RPN8/RPN11
MGAGGVAWVATHPGYEAFAVTADRQAVWTPGLEAWLVT